MKKLITIFNIKNIEKFYPYVDGFIIGNNDFSGRLTTSFSIDQINEIIDKGINNNKEIFLNVNQMFTDQQLKQFIQIFKQINYQKLTGIICADLGTIVELQKLKLNNKLVYNPETLLTNQIDFNFLSSEIKGAFVAKEITIDDVLLIGKNKQMELFFLGHGHLNMFYSKRKLLNNYQQLTNNELDFNFKQNLKIIEPNKRKNTPYPIYQDLAGTHVFRSKVMNSFQYLDQLEKVVDYFVIDTIFKNDDYGLEIAKLYFNKNNENIEEIQTRYNESWDNGFLDKKTYYKR